MKESEEACIGDTCNEVKTQIQWDFYPVRGLKWCDSTNCKFKYVNRDKNASSNILDKYHWFAQEANADMPLAFSEPYKPDAGDESNFIRLVSVVKGSKFIRTFGHLRLSDFMVCSE